MEIAVIRTDCTEHSTPLLVAKVFQGTDDLVGPLAKIDGLLAGQIQKRRTAGDFKGEVGESMLLFPSSPDVPFERLLLVGLGKADDFDLEGLRRAAGTAIKQASRLKIESFASLMHHAELASSKIDPEQAGQAAAEGFVLGGYTFDQFKKSDDEPKPRITRIELLEKEADKADALERGARTGSAIAEGENLARTLGNLPGNVATPTYLADQAKEIAKRFDMKSTILGPSEMKKEGMGALLAVAQGSEQEPRLIILEHRGGQSDQAPIMLVGKGLTFDAGGISIKPAAGMEEMKFDMCGGAAVLGAMQAIGELDLPVNVVAVVPSSENLISGEAVKPGDIITAYSGKTIEIINTDAEGRLILADALAYAIKLHNPVAVVDAATLTGSCVIALGHHASAVLGNDEALIEELREAGDRSGERVWPLPMHKEYREQLKTEYADIKNSGGRPAGTITAGWFLREFVGDVAWAHLDIAGTAWGDGKISYHIKGSTGAPTRLFVEWVRSRAS